MKSKTYIIFSIIGIALVALTYFVPVWSVALQSIQYPKNMYPKGIRIVFKYNGVYNGCQGVAEREELATNEGADCLVEMNAINHFIGMYPIVQGRNNPKDMSHPSFYVFDTKKDEQGHDIYDENGQKVRVNVTPKALKVLNALMVSSPYIFVFFVLCGIFFMVTTRRLNGLAAWIAALTPLYFLMVYIFYLYWYGHNLGLHGGGAFAGIKPFMPTVFGEGKVAQFTTESYPMYGFFIALGAFVSFVLAFLLKRKALKTN
ncbi:hypothetical protein MASR2M12_18170 [Bacteroidales bacterium]